ncbi:uncharacterized protein LOC107883265 [Acyrthosiphon pisum]|uniref:Uncharacterized protein n=1 Tax=Acyrthosiphon pisum TaxID=7029 RepID=A0A8R2H5D8_ACYPI|nr:uncharacterized protein LOC107883265 [Acyrthosiphon pisum]|eukprot:XP_016658418.1 PREDICTED: uncharacterized protein LOC107883265 [Acyrthosiphon pisum]
MTPYEAVFGQKPRMGLATKVPRELLDNIMTGTLEEDMMDMLFDPPTTISTHTIPEYRNDEVAEVLNIETNDLEDTHEELLEINTACSLHVTPENGVQQLDNLIKTTRNILEIESDTDENTEEVIFDHPALTRRKIAAQNLKSQADRMVTRGKGILPPLKVGDNVLVPIPSVDRGRGDAANLLSVIIEENDGKFRIATKEGILSTWLERNSLAATKYCSLTTADVQNLNE